jgi:hypothetical protein
MPRSVVGSSELKDFYRSIKVFIAVSVELDVADLDLNWPCVYVEGLRDPFVAGEFDVGQDSFPVNHHYELSVVVPRPHPSVLLVLDGQSACDDQVSAQEQSVIDPCLK